MPTFVPFAIQKPVVNHSGVMNGHLGVVAHVQVGTGSCYDFFDIPASQASSHLWVAKSGAIEQYVDLDYIAWAEMAGNGYYVSIETEGFPTDPWTPQQVQALAQLYDWIAGEYALPFETCDHGGRGLTTHAHYPSGVPDPSWGDHPCPGSVRSAQVPDVLLLAQKGITTKMEPQIWHDATREIVIGIPGCGPFLLGAEADGSVLTAPSNEAEVLTGEGFAYLGPAMSTATINSALAAGS